MQWRGRISSTIGTVAIVASLKTVFHDVQGSKISQTLDDELSISDGRMNEMRMALIAKRACVALLCGHAVALTLFLLVGAWWDTAAMIGGWASVVIAVVSTLVGVGAILSGHLLMDRRLRDWALVVLVLNVLPYVVLMVAGAMFIDF